MSRSTTTAPNAASVCIAIRRSPKISNGSRPASSSGRAIISAYRPPLARRADAAPDAAVAASRGTERAGLAQRFIHHNRNRVGEIQAAHACLEDWNPISAVISLGQEIAAETFRLASEKEKVAALVMRVEIRRRGVRREKFR